VPFILKGVRAEAIDIPWSNSIIYELDLQYDDSISNAIKFKLGYRKALFDKTLVESFINSFKELIFRVINQEIINCKTYCVLDIESYNRIVYQSDNTEKEYLQDKTICGLFEEQVVKTPNNIAVVDEDIQLSYTKLNQKANQLASYLRKVYHIKGDDLIALCLDKSQYMLIAIFGVLKAGGAYVPIDPGYPDDRIHYILEDTKANVLITTSHYYSSLRALAGQSNERSPHFHTRVSVRDDRISHCEQSVAILLIDSPEFAQILNKHPKTNSTSNINSSNLAYVIYTSGTTGKPKGVMIEHKNLVAFTLGFTHYPFNNEIQANMLSTTNYVFDVFGLEYLLPLLNGGKVHLIDLFKFTQKLNLIRYDCIQITPSKIEWLVNCIDYKIHADAIHKIKLLVGGEMLNQNALHELYNLHEKLLGEQQIDCEIINVYGPTETTIWSTAKQVDLKNFKDNLGNIGRPLINQSIYVLDNNLNLMPKGSVGEIYIGGAGLARGYLNQPILTADKFIESPFYKHKGYCNKGKLLYKTGDLAKFLADGSLEYIGRNDYQVKIRGHRIELGEIESLLCSYPGIKQCIVTLITLENNKQYLVAYYSAEVKILDEKITAYLGKFLPDFMLPNKLFYVTHFPLTSNGKIDRGRLPRFDPDLLTDKNYIVARNKFETDLSKIFADILGMDANQISIHDDFFKLGGTSIAAIKLGNKIKYSLGIDIEVSNIFKYRTIYQLATNIGVFKKNGDGPIVSDDYKFKDYILSCAQERLWFIAKYREGNKAYNVPLIFKLTSNCNIKVLQKSIKAVIKRHVILRTILKEDEFGNVVASVSSSSLTISRKYPKTKKELDYSLRKAIEHVFNLTNEIPIRVCNYEYKNEYYISIIVHHIAFDGWSGEILIHDLIKYYEYYQNVNKKANILDLPDIKIQYKDFAIWQRSYLQSKAIEKQLSYWSEKLHNYENLNLPIDKPRPILFDYEGKTVEFTLPLSLSTQLRQCAKELSVSLNSLLLSGFYLLLRVYSNQNDVVLGTVVSNRHYRNIDNLVGFFVNSLVLRQQINGEDKVIDFINTVFNEILESQLNQDVPFGQLVEKFNFNKDPSRHPIFQVVFVVQDFGGEYQHLLSEYNNANLYHTAKFDICLVFDSSHEQLKGKIEYATSLFELKTIKGYLETYEIILKQLSKIYKQQFENKQIKDINYLTKANYKKYIVDYNNVFDKFNYDKTVHQLFEEQVKKNPQNIAVVFEDKQLTYQELNNRANQLANYLRETYQTKGDDLIALCLNRSEYMLIAILGVLKSGAAYVPIAPDYPIERIKFILKDTDAKVLIADSKIMAKAPTSLRALHSNAWQSKENRLSGLAMDNLVIDNKKVIQLLRKYKTTNPELNITNKNLAYVIYTSGTTGNPKGVMVQHDQVVGFSINNNYLSVNKDTVVLGYSNYAFDGSVFDIFTTILNGGELIIIDRDLVLDATALRYLVMKHRINTLFITTALFSQYASLEENNPLIGIRNILFGGEKVNTNELKLFVRKNPKVNLVHVYGPTENIVFSTSCKITIENCDVAPIGKNLNDKKIYILDNTLNPVPLGAIGELCIGGVGVARGYLNQSELTDDKFILNPFEATCHPRRIYKTGDLADF
ncbi:MAG TPA: amino acid adenylation domain-containing protein, partial [Aquella sp.]|nr:amino acid adenylation domain-containing protein [Aquella sp.]